MSQVFACRAIGCNVNNAIDETLEDYFYCEDHFTLNESEANE